MRALDRISLLPIIVAQTAGGRYIVLTLTHSPSSSGSTLAQRAGHVVSGLILEATWGCAHTALRGPALQLCAWHAAPDAYMGVEAGGIIYDGRPAAFESKVKRAERASGMQGPILLPVLTPPVDA